MIKYGYIRYYLLQIIFLSSMLPNYVHSQQIRMGPPIIEIMTTPGSQKSFYVNILNQSDSDVQCSMFIKSLDLTDQGMPVPVDSSARSAAVWLKIQGDSNFILPGKENKRVRCSFFPSVRAKAGGYYGMIVCRTSKNQNIQDPQNMKSSIHMRFQFTSVVMAIIKGSHVQANIIPEAPTIFSGDRTSKNRRDWYVEIPVRNDGNIHVVLSGEVRLLSETGHQITKLDLVSGRGYLLPNKKRTFKAVGLGPLPDGIYIAAIRIGQSDIKKYATERIPFYILKGQVFPGSPNKDVSNSLATTSQGFILNKPFLNLEAIPGGRQFNAIQISNITSHPISLTSKKITWNHDVDGNIILSERKYHNNQIKNNIIVTPDSFKIGAGKKRNVKLNIKLPKESNGEYYDAILFNRIGTPTPESMDLLLTQSVLLSTIAKGTEKVRCEILNFTVNQIKSKGFIFTIMVKNSGNVKLFLEGRISVFDSNNQKIDKTLEVGGNAFVLPNMQRKFEVELERLLPKGGYRAELAIEYYSGQQTLKKILEFNAQ